MDNQQNKCAICQDIINENDTVFTTICNHTFHQECWTQLSNSSLGDYKCPLCRTQQRPGDPDLTDDEMPELIEQVNEYYYLNRNECSVCCA